VRRQGSQAPMSWKERKSHVRHKWVLPLHFFEWACERLAFWMSRWAFIEILEYLGRFSVLVAVIFYLLGYEDRLKNKHYQAWQVVNSAYGRPGNGGRTAAIEDLNSDGVSLSGVALIGDSSGGAELWYVQLPNADLYGANLRGAALGGANLQGADLAWANLQGAILNKSNLQGANLAAADLQGANLINVNLQETDLEATILQDALLWQADLTTAHNLTREQVLSAWDWRGAKLPPHLKDIQLPSNAPEEVLQRLRATLPPREKDSWRERAPKKLMP
jgi:hypothetical protein